jgi:fucose 4-O-acetylase-like acetyltransferase
VSGSRGRVAAIDNARFVLIGLVVLGHAIQPMTTTQWVESAYAWLYLFHMPAFVLLCGLVIADPAMTTERASKVFAGLIVPFVLFDLLYRGFAVVRTEQVEVFFRNPTVPTWSMWFLLALAAWRMLAPLVAALRWPVVMVTLLALALSALGPLPRDFSVGRIIMLLPFFAAGLMLTGASFDKVPPRRWRLAAVAVLTAAVPFAWLVATRLDRDYLLWTGRADRDGWDDLLVQSVLYVAAAAMVAAVLVLVPRRTFRWTHRGERSLYVYLLHIPILIVLRSWLTESELPVPALVAIAVGAAVVVTFVLSSDLVHRLTRPLVQPDVRWLLARRDGTSKS